MDYASLRSLLKDPKKSGNGDLSFCPCHNDNTRSLSTSFEGEKILLHCHAGCRTEDVVKAMGLTMGDLFLTLNKQPLRNNFNIVAEYPYEDETGKLIYQAVKLQPKSFRVRQIDKDGNWAWNLKGIEPLPYKLPQLLKAIENKEAIFIPEGEKDVESLVALGLVATTNHGGAGKWRKSHSKYFPAGVEVVILPDNDKPGKDHAESVAAQLFARGCRIKIIELPGLREKEDISDWLNMGHTREDLLKLADDIPYWEGPNESAKGEMPEDSCEIDPQYLETDLRNARRLVEKHGKDLRYVQKWKEWLYYDGSRWIEDTTGEIYRRAKDIAEDVFLELASYKGDRGTRESLWRCAKYTESRNGIMAMVRLAESEPDIAISPEQLDCDPWSLNVLNGTLDLKTGKLRPHNRGNMLMKLVPYKYDPESQCPTWDAFLQKIFENDIDLIRYVKKCLGYSITGSIREHAIFICKGPRGRNGKTTLINPVQEILTEYATTINPEVLMAKKNEGSAQPELVALRGARFVPASEIEEGRRLKVAQVKVLTGGDIVQCRDLYQKPFNFKPQFKIWMLTNWLPRVPGDDEAVFERIKVIPFNYYLKPEERDKELPEKLQEEYPGILRWLIEGCLAWQTEGLKEPSRVKLASKEYRTDSDSLRIFIDETCNTNIPAAKVRLQQLYDGFKRWGEQNKEYIISRRKFSDRLRKFGFSVEEGTGGVFWVHGLGYIDYSINSNYQEHRSGVT